MFRYILQLEGKWEQHKAVYHPDRRQYKLEGICPFLETSATDPNITACKIYSFRPTVCKLYPLTGKCYCVNDQDNIAE
jgi:Fe-S-cluster containining protein